MRSAGEFKSNGKSLRTIVSGIFRLSFKNGKDLNSKNCKNYSWMNQNEWKHENGDDFSMFYKTKT